MCHFTECSGKDISEWLMFDLKLNIQKEPSHVKIREFQGESSASTPNIQILSTFEGLVQMQPQPQTFSYLPTWISAHNTFSLQCLLLYILDVSYLCTSLSTLLEFPILQNLLFFLSPPVLNAILIQTLKHFVNKRIKEGRNEQRKNGGILFHLWKECRRQTVGIQSLGVPQKVPQNLRTRLVLLIGE